MMKTRRQIKAIKSKQHVRPPSQYAPKQKGETEIHYMSRTGIILTPYHWKWDGRKKRMVSTLHKNDIED